PQHDLAKRQMDGFGGMLAFETGSLEAARRGVDGLRRMGLAESLGRVGTHVSPPATMTHASVPADRRAAIGITDGLVRISAGIEDIEDLKEDLTQALDRVSCSISSCTSTSTCWSSSPSTGDGSTGSCSRSSSRRPGSS